MAEQESKAEISSHTYTMEATKANTSYTENNLKIAEQTSQTWGRREYHTEKGEAAEL